MPSYRTELLNRIVAMQKEALDAWVVATFPTKEGLDAKPYFLYQQEMFPYIVNRIGPSTPDNEDENTSIRDYVLTMRVVIAHVTSGMTGENEGWLNESFPLLETYLLKHPMLNTDAPPYDEWPDWIYPEGVELSDTAGLDVFPDSGIGTLQIGEELSVIVKILRDIDP